jgi:RNA polymerase sigma factor (sigma-70 family)
MAAYYGCDRTAFGSIARQWWALLFSFFRGLGWPDPDAEDLAQETLFRILRTKERGTGQYDPGQGPFAGWAYRIGGHLSAEVYRQRRRRPTTPLGEFDVAEERAPGPEGGDLRQDIRDCLNDEDFTPREREFLVLWEGALGQLTQSAIAERLRVSAVTVTRIKESAVDKLRASLQRRGYS